MSYLFSYLKRSTRKEIFFFADYATIVPTLETVENCSEEGYSQQWVAIEFIRVLMLIGWLDRIQVV